MATKRAHNDNARRAACLGKRDTLMESGHKDLSSQINNSPMQTYMDNIALLMNREDQPKTRNNLRAFHWNNTKILPTPLSYAMVHFVSVDLGGKSHEQQQQYTASLHIAFHLIRKGADPRQVDPGVRYKVLAEYQRRAAADDIDDMRPFTVEEEAVLKDFLSGPHGGDDDPALLRACQKPGVYAHGPGSDSYDPRLSRRP